MSSDARQASSITVLESLIQVLTIVVGNNKATDEQKVTTMKAIKEVKKKSFITEFFVSFLKLTI